MRGCILTVATLAMALAGCVQPTDPSPTPATPNTTPTKPKPTPTAGGIYLTPAKAFHRWQADPQRVHILDVRTPAEFLFGGRATMARNVPVMMLANRWDAERSQPAWSINKSFAADVKKHCKAGDTILVMCRSGERSLKAVSVLKAAGFTDVHNIRGGFEGEIAEDCNCPNADSAAVPGWKSAGMPWTMKMEPTLMYQP